MSEYRRLVDESSAKEPSDDPATIPIDRRGFGPGSFGALVNDYLVSSGFRELKPRTAAEYRRVIEALQKEHGDKRVAQIERRHVRKMRDARARRVPPTRSCG